ncbi:hypothetical protein BDF22DRAFT_688647 [Syncephalis plumigaleata]|nr:hypothetical protein BDF22DRAFT_688647 [Syncephalis plumigaleata]
MSKRISFLLLLFSFSLSRSHSLFSIIVIVITMTLPSSICVFCGSSSGVQPEYLQAAEDLGRVFLKHNITLIYGGGNMGLMGRLAQTVHDGGGKVISIIPRALNIGDSVNYGTVHITKDMHERKAMMNKLADAFITLPGGFGTFEELLEMTTWSQLCIHDKPVIVLDICNFYDMLFKFFDHTRNQGFVSPTNREIVQRCSSVDLVEKALMEYKVPPRTFNLTWIEGEPQALV